MTAWPDETCPPRPFFAGWRAPKLTIAVPAWRCVGISAAPEPAPQESVTRAEMAALFAPELRVGPALSAEERAAMAQTQQIRRALYG